MQWWTRTIQILEQGIGGTNNFNKGTVSNIETNMPFYLIILCQGLLPLSSEPFPLVIGLNLLA